MSVVASEQAPRANLGHTPVFTLDAARCFARVLVLDGDPVPRLLAARVLRCEGHTVQARGTVEEAVRLTRDHDVDIAVVGCRPGGGIGADAVASLLGARRDLPVIALGAADACELVISAMRAGARSFVREPLEPQDLVRAVAAALAPASASSRSTPGDLWPQVQAATHAAYALDADGCVRHVDHSFAALLGATPDELVGAHFSRLVYEPDLPRARWRFNERRTGERASANVALRLRRFPVEGGDDDDAVPVQLWAAGRYATPADAGGAARFLGTVGLVRASEDALPAVIGRRSIASRSGFMTDLAAAIAQVKRDGGHLAVVVVNIDRFKIVNDSFGHLAGDRLLKELASRLRQAIGEGEPLTRLGGDEFAALLSLPRSGAEAKLVAARMLEALRRPLVLENEPYAASASVGIAIFPDHGADERLLLRAADRAMREAKRRGGDQVLAFSAAMERTHSSDADLERDLRAGLQRGELEVCYQPIHDLASGCVASFEALVRWRHPALGLLEPGRFIHLAEESGLVHALGRQVLACACVELSRWRACGFADLRVAVNLSARDFERDDCVEAIADTLARHALPPDALEIEVTEHSLLAAGDAAARAAELRRHGVQLSIDDFGTKYSSLAYLQRLPVSTIKVDRAFVREVGYSHASDSIVQALIGIARALGLRLVAEGVEEIEQVRWLRRLGCHLMQGYLFSRPLPAAAVRDYLARNCRPSPAGSAPQEVLPEG